MDEDEASFDPEEELRDYGAVARSLPVFCVSARAYQKLSGRLRKDAVYIDGFLSVADTEIPALQEHTLKLTEAGRMSSCRRFLNDLHQLLNSMKLCASTENRIVLSEKDQDIDDTFLRAQLASLEIVSAPTSWKTYPVRDANEPSVTSSRHGGLHQCFLRDSG